MWVTIYIIMKSEKLDVGLVTVGLQTFCSIVHFVPYHFKAHLWHFCQILTKLCQYICYDKIYDWWNTVLYCWNDKHWWAVMVTRKYNDLSLTCDKNMHMITSNLHTAIDWFSNDTFCNFDEMLLSKYINQD